MDIIQAGGKQCVHCREVVHSSECPLSEVPLYSLIVCPPRKVGSELLVFSPKFIRTV